MHLEPGRPSPGRYVLFGRTAYTVYGTDHCGHSTGENALDTGQATCDLSCAPQANMLDRASVRSVHGLSKCDTVCTYVPTTPSLELVRTLKNIIEDPCALKPCMQADTLHASQN